MNIISKNMKQFILMENQLYEKQGIALQITNNRRKSMLKSDIIINIDFTTEELNRCSFSKKAIIINIKHKTKINAKKFEGININDYSINIKNETLNQLEKNKQFKSFLKSSIYESILYENRKNDIQINFLIGMSGKIEEKEFKIQENIK